MINLEIISKHRMNPAQVQAQRAPFGTGIYRFMFNNKVAIFAPFAVDLQYHPGEELYPGFEDEMERRAIEKALEIFAEKRARANK